MLTKLLEERSELEKKRFRLQAKSGAHVATAKADLALHVAKLKLKIEAFVSEAKAEIES